MPNTVLKFILIILLAIFVTSIFYNIQHPLFWNDESETAMGAERVLDFGYPKVHDSKNTLYHLLSPVGINEKYDANLICGWTQYYFAAPFAALARTTDNIYLKTAIIRIPFALAGLLGLALLSLLFNYFTPIRSDRLKLTTLFFFFELLSVPLILNIREARYYSLLLFLLSVIILIYVDRIYSKRLPFWLYAALMISTMFLLFNAFYPAFFITGFSITIHQLILFVSKKNIKTTTKELFPLGVAFLMILPLIFFFRIFLVSGLYFKSAGLPNNYYFLHLGKILTFFYQYDFLSLAILLKILLFILIFYQSKKTRLSLFHDIRVQLSFILTGFFVIYISFIATSAYMLERYFINLQPILSIIILMDGFLVFDYIKFRARNLIGALILIVFILNSANAIDPMIGHFYEMFNQYKGPLDYIIPYVQQHYKKLENLIIATNYEETSYMYYLRCKVIMGAVFNNFQKDILETPDIIIFRECWGNYPSIYNYLHNKAKYKKVSFPVTDYPVNNIPEFNWSISHLFQTRYATCEAERLFIFVKE